MAKWHGVIGYAVTGETAPGVWRDTIIERNYKGDVIRNSSSWQAQSNSTNDSLNVNNSISIVADPFAYENFHSMKYVEFMGTKWKIETVDASQRPRLTLTMGGVYNGE